MRIGISLVALALICTAYAPGVVAAESEAVEAFKQGVARFKDDDFEGAVESFRKAQALKPSWKLNYNIGQCEAALKRYGLAIEAFERYLSEGGDAVPTARKDEVLSELSRMRQMVGILEVEGRDGLEVFVDDIYRGATPMGSGILISAGVSHRFKIMDGEEEVLAREDVVRGGLHLTLKIDEDEPETDELQPVPVDRGLEPAAFWVASASTVALGAAAVIMEITIQGKIDEIEAGDDSLRDGTRNLQVANYVIIGITGAALVTTGVLALLTDFGKESETTEPEETLSVAPWATGGGGGLVVGGRF